MGVGRADGLAARHLPLPLAGIGRGWGAGESRAGAELDRSSSGGLVEHSAGWQRCGAAAVLAAAARAASSTSAASDCRCRRTSRRSLRSVTTEAAPTASTATHSSTVET